MCSPAQIGVAILAAAATFGEPKRYAPKPMTYRMANGTMSSRTVRRASNVNVGCCKASSMDWLSVQFSQVAMPSLSAKCRRRQAGARAEYHASTWSTGSQRMVGK